MKNILSVPAIFEMPLSFAVNEKVRGDSKALSMAVRSRISYLAGEVQVVSVVEAWIVVSESSSSLSFSRLLASEAPFGLWGSVHAACDNEGG